MKLQFVEDEQNEASEPLIPKEKNTNFKPISEQKKERPIYITTEQTTKPKIDKKGIKTKASINTIKNILDDTNITQDDLWFLVRYFTRDKISTFRESKKALEPIFKDFINRKLNGAEK